jgi:hypothetical protein
MILFSLEYLVRLLLVNRRLKYATKTMLGVIDICRYDYIRLCNHAWFPYLEFTSFSAAMKKLTSGMQ